jgi:ribonuclease D
MNLKPRGQALLRALVSERDRIAMEENRPHRVVMPDGALLELVRRQPDNKSDLAAIRGMPRPTSERWSSDLIDLIGRADELEIPKRRHTGTSAESASDQVAVDALWTIICTRLLALGIAPGMVISRSSLASWFLNERKTEARPLFEKSDWRHQALGQWLDDFLAGNCHLSVSWGQEGAVVGESDSTKGAS